MTGLNQGVLLSLLMPVWLSGLGCEQDRGREATRDRDRVSRNGDVVISRDPLDDGGRTSRGRDRDSDLSRRGFRVIPERAVRVRSVEDGNEAEYVADRDGTIYLYDFDDDAVVYSGHLHRDERFILDPRDNVALIEGRPVLSRGLDAGHRYRIYFAADR